MTREELLTTCGAFLLDLDGTVYLSEKPIGNMLQTLERLRKMGKRIAFVTNASLHSDEVYRARLKEIGVFREGDFLYTSGTAALSLLRERYAGKRVCMLAVDEMKENFRRAGVNVVEENAEVCLLAYDTSATFAKLKQFNECLQQGAVYLATHADLVCPTATLPQPDAGAFIALFKAASGREPDVVCGKPGAVIARLAARDMQLAPHEMCMVGDRLYTDIRFGNENGMRSLLVLTGEARRDNLHDHPDRPDLILPTFNDLLA